MAGEVAQHRTALLRALVGVDLAEHGLRSRLVQPPIEDELAAVLGIVEDGQEGPAREHLGESDHIVLGVAARTPSVCSSRISRARFSLRPRLRLMPATELGPIEPALSR